MPPPAIASPAPPEPAAAPLPPEPTEGRLVAGHYAALGQPGTRPDEPLAPPGQWLRADWGWAWVPDYLHGSPGWEVVIAASEEIFGTLPRFEHDGPALPYPAGPKPGTRVVLLPGPSFAYGSLLVAGLYARALWQEPDGSFSDVIWLGLTDAATRAAVPPGHPYRLYCPAAGHELAHQWGHAS